jgi:hypothetical protein
MTMTRIRWEINKDAVVCLRNGSKLLASIYPGHSKNGPVLCANVYGDYPHIYKQRLFVQLSLKKTKDLVESFLPELFPS